MIFHEKKILESTYKDVVPIESCHKLNGLTHIYPVLLKWNGAIYLRYYESLEKKAIFCLSTSRVMNLLHILSSKNWRTKSVTSIGQINYFLRSKHQQWVATNRRKKTDPRHQISKVLVVFRSSEQRQSIYFFVSYVGLGVGVGRCSVWYSLNIATSRDPLKYLYKALFWK